LDIQTELQSTCPDYVVYVPQSDSGDTGNEHFLVFDGPDGALMAIWTQSTFEGMPDQHTAFARSDDEGLTWSPPRTIAGPDPQAGVGMASWAFPMVSRSGRIYVLFSRHIGINDYATHTTGLMGGIYSDDAGATWSPERTVPMPRSKWDNPDPSIPANWIVWQKPLRLSAGKYLAGFTRWISPTIRPASPVSSWIGHASVVEFMRFANLDDDPEIDAFRIDFFASDDDALQVGFPDHPEVSVVQEPSLVSLPDGRLFCAVRTSTGHPYYTLSTDEGRTWQAPEPMRQSDDGPLFLHPLSPCPIYQVDAGEYFFLLHNHDGHFEEWGPTDTSWHRRPICIARGLFDPDARQPIRFSEPRFLMDNGGLPLGHGSGRSDLAMYASVTIRNQIPVLWYPERKFFLLGKRLTREYLASLDGG
jgi:hypothetical protein